MTRRALPVWIERDPAHAAPPIDAGLDGWEIEKRRPTHWNARRTGPGGTWFLKWFFHGIFASPARAEWRAAHEVRGLGIATVDAVGWGRHSGGTFVVLRGSPGFPVAEWRRLRLCDADWRRLAAELAAQTARLHAARLCHRDLNVYHVLLSDTGLRWIDVGRVTRFLRRRWVVKDLASLLASAEREGVPRWVARAFARHYLARSASRWRRRTLLARVLRKAGAYHRHHERQARRREGAGARGNSGASP